MWLVDNFGHPVFPDAPWHHNGKWAGGGDLPAVAALKEEWKSRPFERGNGESPPSEPPEEKRHPDWFGFDPVGPVEGDDLSVWAWASEGYTDIRLMVGNRQAEYDHVDKGANSFTWHFKPLAKMAAGLYLVQFFKGFETLVSWTRVEVKEKGQDGAEPVADQVALWDDHGGGGEMIGLMVYQDGVWGLEFSLADAGEHALTFVAEKAGARVGRASVGVTVEERGEEGQLEIEVLAPQDGLAVEPGQIIRAECRVKLTPQPKLR